LCQFLPERRAARLTFRIVRERRVQHVDPSHSLRLLRTRNERPSTRRTNNPFNEIAPSHCLTPKGSGPRQLYA
jgi:hypothetical protein